MLGHYYIPKSTIITHGNANSKTKYSSRNTAQQKKINSVTDYTLY